MSYFQYMIGKLGVQLLSYVGKRLVIRTLDVLFIPLTRSEASTSPAGGKIKKHTLPSNADNGADKGNSSSEENPSVHRST